MGLGIYGSASPSLLPPLTSAGILEEATSQTAGKSPRIPQTRKGMMGFLFPATQSPKFPLRELRECHQAPFASADVVVVVNST